METFILNLIKTTLYHIWFEQKSLVFFCSHSRFNVLSEMNSNAGCQCLCLLIIVLVSAWVMKVPRSSRNPKKCLWEFAKAAAHLPVEPEDTQLCSWSPKLQETNSSSCMFVMSWDVVSKLPPELRHESRYHSDQSHLDATTAVTQVGGTNLLLKNQLEGKLTTFKGSKL